MWKMDQVYARGWYESELGKLGNQKKCSVPQSHPFGWFFPSHAGCACQNWLSPTKYTKILCLISFVILFPIRIAIFGMYATFSAQTNPTNPNGSGSKMDTQK